MPTFSKTGIFSVTVDSVHASAYADRVDCSGEGVWTPCTAATAAVYNFCYNGKCVSSEEYEQGRGLDPVDSPVELYSENVINQIITSIPDENIDSQGLITSLDFVGSINYETLVDNLQTNEMGIWYEKFYSEGYGMVKLYYSVSDTSAPTIGWSEISVGGEFGISLETNPFDVSSVSQQVMASNSALSMGQEIRSEIGRVSQQARATTARRDVFSE